MKALISSIILILFLSLSVFTQTGETACPEIQLISLDDTLEVDVPVKFLIKMDEKTDISKFEFEWMISKGKIIQGQGTPEITFLVNLEDSKVDSIDSVKVSVNINGLPKSCSKSYFSEFLGFESSVVEPIFECTFGPQDKTFFGDVRRRIDLVNLQINNELDKNPKAEGLINLKFDKRNRRKDKINLLKEIGKFIKLRQYDIQRFTFAISEDESEERVSSTFLLSESNVLEFTDKNAVIIKGEDLKKSINNLFPLK